jgi:hypothetical protein
MTTIVKTHAPAQTRFAEQDVDRSVQRHLNDCPYAFIFCKVTLHFEDGRLTLRGCVPSFYSGMIQTTDLNRSLPLVETDQLSFGENMPGHGLDQLLPRSASLQVKLHIQSVQLKEIAVWPTARRWCRATIANVVSRP